MIDVVTEVCEREIRRVFGLGEMGDAGMRFGCRLTLGEMQRRFLCVRVFAVEEERKMKVRDLGSGWSERLGQYWPIVGLKLIQMVKGFGLG